MSNNTELKLAARANGERFYFTGVPCKHGHVTKRYASTGGCVACLSVASPTKLTIIQSPFTLNTVVPLEFDINDRIGLETYLVECTMRYCDAIGKPMPFEPYRIQWAKEHKRPISECPL